MPLRTKKEIQKHLKAVFQRPANGNQSKRNPETSGDERTTKNVDEESPTASISEASQASFEGDETEETMSEPPESEVSTDMQLPDARIEHPFPRNGKVLFQSQYLRSIVKEVAHKRYSRFNVADHLYSLNFEVNDNRRRPRLVDIEEVLHLSLISVLEKLKKSYPPDEDFQIYLTVIAPGIKSGLNTGNYSLRTPSAKIVRWMLSMLYNYLKSNQTLKLDKKFHVKIKVLSVEHTKSLQKHRQSFKKHVYH